MRKTLATLVATMAALGVVGATGGTAYAGERGGTGAQTPIGSYTANSLCAFSGLEDQDHNENGVIDPGEEVQPGVVQNWGSIPKEIRDMLTLIGENPGNACNGHKTPAKGGFGG